MPPKKSKTAAPAADAMKAFDRQYYELTITDLNNKLSRLRSFNETVEERSIELEAKMRQLEEDRTDVTAFLDRSLTHKISTNKDLEDKLSELAKVRDDEKTEFLRQIREGDLKFKTMQEELTSEIKLLTGKLNSVEEFRVQKDELLAKFDQQESELRVQTKQHRDLIYDIERKQVMDKDRLKKEVENKLLELSNEFAKSNEIRISAHVQRLVRENIALNNELDRMMFSQRRLQNENKKILSEATDRRNYVESFRSENENFVRVCDQQVAIIRKMTTELESTKAMNASLCEADKLRKLAEKRDTSSKQNSTILNQKVHLLEQHVHALRSESVNLHTMYKQQSKEMERLTDILLKLKFTVKSAARGEKRNLSDDPEFRKAQRENLLSELMEVLNVVYKAPEPVLSLETVGSVEELYRRGNIGMTPEQSALSLMMAKPIGRIQASRLKASVMMAVKEETAKRRASQSSVPIIDLESGSMIVMSESTLGEAPPDENEMEEGEDLGVSSSDEEQAPKPQAAVEPVKTSTPQNKIQIRVKSDEVIAPVKDETKEAIHEIDEEQVDEKIEDIEKDDKLLEMIESSETHVDLPADEN